MATRRSVSRLMALLAVVAIVSDRPLVVVVADLPRVLSQPGRRFLARGMPARLDCPADANPPVTDVRWTKNGRPLDASSLPDHGSWPWRLKVTERGALLFRSVSPDDAGRYSCTPYSQLGEGRPSVPVQLIVKGQYSFLNHTAHQDGKGKGSSIGRGIEFGADPGLYRSEAQVILITQVI